MVWHVGVHGETVKYDAEKRTTNDAFSKGRQLLYYFCSFTVARIYQSMFLFFSSVHLHVVLRWARFVLFHECTAKVKIIQFSYLLYYMSPVRLMMQLQS